MGSAGRSGSAATTRATSAQTDGAILADAERADGDGDVSEPHPTRRGRNAPGLQKRPDY